MPDLTIPDELAQEVAADLAAGGERAARWRPDLETGKPWTVVNLIEFDYADYPDGPMGGQVREVCPAGALVRSNHRAWGYVSGPFAVVGSADDPESPRPVEGDRVLVLDGEEDAIGHVCPYMDETVPPGPIVVVLDGRHEQFADRWAILPAPWVETSSPEGDNGDLDWHFYPGPDPRGHWDQVHYAWVMGRPKSGGVSTTAIFVDRVDESFGFEACAPLADRIAELLNGSDAALAEVSAERDRLAQHTHCRHHDKVCSAIAAANEALGAEVVRLRAENARLRGGLEDVRAVDPAFDDAIDEAFDIARDALACGGDLHADA